MSVSAYALGTILPVAASSLGSLAATTARASGDFLKKLGEIPSLAENTSADAATGAGLNTNASPADGSLEQRTESWGNRLVSWLRSKGIRGPISFEANLSSLDQTQIAASGPQRLEIESALADAPDLLAEFRELALDAEQASNSPWGSQSASGPSSFDAYLRRTLRFSSEHDQLSLNWS